MESFGPPKQNLRGMNKPKCIQCGNVARSRCPFQSCKGCCSKAQNPCHIHVLKQSSSTLPDKPPPSASPLSEQPSIDTHHVKGASTVRLSSLRQLSSNLANTLRTKRPLSRKDAININKWRFSKLREHINEEIETENEAFDRYMRNVRLLEEALSIKRDDETPNSSIIEDGHGENLISATKAKLQCSATRSQNNLERTQSLVDELLGGLQDGDKDEDIAPQQLEEEADEGDVTGVKRRKVLMSRSEKIAAAQDLLDKLLRVRTDDDLRLCVEMKQKLSGEQVNRGNREVDSVGPIVEAGGEGSTEASDVAHTPFSFSFPKLWAPVENEEDDLSNIDASLLSVNDVIQL